jgi:hypothetical protein
MAIVYCHLKVRDSGSSEPLVIKLVPNPVIFHLQVVKHRPITSQGLSYTTFEAPKASRLQIPTVPRPTITTFSSAGIYLF